MKCEPTYNEQGDLTGYKYRQVGMVEIRRRDQSLVAAEARKKKSVITKKIDDAKKQKDDIEFRMYQLQKKKENLERFIGKMNDDLEIWDEKDIHATNCVRRLDVQIARDNRKEKVWVDKKKCAIYKQIMSRK